VTEVTEAIQASDPLAELGARLTRWFRGRLPDRPGLRVVGLRPADRGMAAETTHFRLEWDGGSERLVLRRPPARPLLPDFDIARQYQVMQQLAPTGLPVPRTRWIEQDATVTGRPFYVMDEIPGGQSVSDFPTYHSWGLYHDATPQGRRTLWRRCVATMARIHGLDWQALGLGFLDHDEGGAHRVDNLVRHLGRALAWAEPEPGAEPELEAAVAWLGEHAYLPERTALCWGDSRMSNILYGPAPDYEVIGVLDWEIAFLGDPEADLAWMLFLDWLNTVPSAQPPAEGTPTREETVAHYEELTGRPVTQLRYNEVLAAVHLAVPLLGIVRELRAAGALTPEADPIRHCVRRIQDLLEGEPGW
jgi:aminoglycoside phosphotransferase (APT) family kinase protein